MVVDSPELGRSFPFSAIVGQDMAKNALLSALVDPSLSSVLLVGGAGTAKTTLVRSLCDLAPGLKIVTVPLNAMEEMLFGDMEIETAISEGRMVRSPGLLERANGSMLFMDQVNLFEPRFLGQVLNAAEGGYCPFPNGDSQCRIESRFLFIGCMDPREGGLSPDLLDKFNLCVMMDDVDDAQRRMEIVSRRIRFESRPGELLRELSEKTASLRTKVSLAKARLPFVTCPDGHIETIASLCTELNVGGHRGDIAMVKTSSILAALAGRDTVSVDDVRMAAELCLQHRRRDFDRPDPSTKGHGEGQEANDNSPPMSQGDGRTPGSNHNDAVATDGDHAPSQRQGGKTDDGEEVYPIGDPMAIMLFPNDNRRAKLVKRKGRRGEVISADRSGRYSSYKLPEGTARDIAFDATLRAAAPYQRDRRGRKKMAIVIDKSDLREKVRLRKSGSTILFLVDASASMGARRRMITVKGAILSMLRDAYQKRDVVGMMTFSNTSSTLILPPTKSIELAYQKLRTLPTGGRTPLPLALNKVAEFLSTPRMKGAEDVTLVIVTDGRANVGMNEADPFTATISVAQRMSAMPVRYVVVDSESGYPRMGKAVELCQALGGAYFQLEGMSSTDFAHSVGSIVHGTVRA